MDDAWKVDPGGDLAYTIAGLTPGSRYDVQVRAVNSVGDGGWSTTSAAAGTFTRVRYGWSLRPADIGGGGSFRLLFVTSNTRWGQWTDLAQYDGSVQASAAAGHSDIRAYGAQFKALASSETIAARDNTRTNPNTHGAGEPIYWLNGPRVADNYADLYDGWDNSNPTRTETGASVEFVEPTGGVTPEKVVWTGSASDGSIASGGYMGSANPKVGTPFDGGAPLTSNILVDKSGALRFYSLSGVFRVESPSTTATLSALSVSQVDIVGFSPDHTRYSVGVSDTVNQVTISAVTTNSYATVSYGPAEDADADVEGHQVDLSDGLNTVTVKVTAEDTTTTKTYTVHVGRGVTAAYGWKAVDDFNGLALAGNTAPYGIWSDGVTMWVTEGSGNLSVAGKMYAYNLSTKRRDTDKEFNLAGFNIQPTGVWANADTIWVGDTDRDRLFTYNRETNQPGPYHLHADNTAPTGLWSDGDTLWVADQGQRRIYAYDLATMARVEDKEFVLSSGNTIARGLWSDGVTMWVADSGNDRLYAYDMATKRRIIDREFTTLVDAGNTTAQGLWSDGVTMWVSNDGGEAGSDKLYSYNMPAAATEPGAPTISTVTAGDGTLTVVWSEPGNNGGGDITAYDVRHILSSASDKADASWIVVDNPRAWIFGGGALSVAITGLANASEYDVQVRAVNSVGDGDWSATQTGTPNAATGLPEAPASVTATAGDGQVTLSWTAVEDTVNPIRKYQYRQQEGSDDYDPWTDVDDGADAGTATDDETGLTLTGLSNGTAYRFEVRALNDVGEGAARASSQVTPVAPVSPVVSLVLTPASIAETGGATTVTDTDFTLSANTTLSFAANATASTGIVTIEATGDAEDEANQQITVSGTTAATGVTAPTAKTLTITDDDTRGVTVTPTSLSVDEGDSASYTVVLDSEPTANVTVTPSVTSGGDSDITLTTTTAPTFTPSNWSIPQTITVSAEEDTDSDAGTATIEHAVTGGDYGSNSVTADSVTVTEVDDEAETGAPTISTDATLSSLTVSPGEIHGFASDRVGYHVGVASTVTQVTITAVVTNPQATVSYDVSDSDADADGHQVDLSPGLTRVTVRVTAQDEINSHVHFIYFGRGVTAVYGWKAVDDVNTPVAAGNNHHRGIWSDRDTMWVADYIDDKLYAYDLDTKERDSGKDFVSLDAAGNNHPHGIWSDGAIMWVADYTDDKVYAYELGSGRPISGSDFGTLVAAENQSPTGLWSDGDTMWVADGRDRKLYAYDLSTKERDSGKEFETLVAGENQSPTDIWSDGVTMWVADNGDDKVYAYDLDTKERVIGREFDTLGAAENNDPRGLWSDGRTMWVSDITADKVYSYNMPVSDNADLRTLTLDGAAVAGFDPSRTVYSLRLDETVTQVTVAAQARQLLAEVTGITPDDADAGADGHQVNLSDGRGTVTVTVTAQDGTTKTYTVNVRGDQSWSESDPGPLTVGGLASGEISDRPAIGIGDCDWFRVELAGGKTYQFDLKGRPTGDGTLADPMIFGTYDSEGTAVAYDWDGNRLYKAGGTVTTDPNVDGAQPVHWDNRDGGVGWNARLFFFVPSGQGGAYYLNVIGESGPGSYVLTAAEALTDEIGDGAENAKFILSRDGRSDGVIETPEDVDWFQVRLVASGVYNVEVLGKSWGEDGETLSRPCLAGIYDHNSTLIADTADDRGRLEFTAPTSTAYYVAVCQNARGSAELPPGSYTVRITGVSVPQSVSEPEGEDFSADTSTPGYILVGYRVTGEIQSGTDLDWFAVDLAGGIAYRFEMRGADTEGNTLPEPLISAILDSTGTVLASNAWTRPDDDLTRADFTPTATGRYYVEVTLYFDTAKPPEEQELGTYTLSVDER